MPEVKRLNEAAQHGNGNGNVRIASCNSEHVSSFHSATTAVWSALVTSPLPHLHCLGGETVGSMLLDVSVQATTGWKETATLDLEPGPRRERQVEVSRVRSVLRLSRMLFGRGFAPQSLGCGSIAPTPGPRFLFSTPISVCVCIILEIHYPTATMTPRLGWPQESKSVKIRPGWSAFHSFCLLICDPTSTQNAVTGYWELRSLGKHGG